MSPEKRNQIGYALSCLAQMSEGDPLPASVVPLIDEIRKGEWSNLLSIIREDQREVVCDDDGTPIGRRMKNVDWKDEAKLKVLEIDSMTSEFGVDELNKGELQEILREWFPFIEERGMPTSKGGRRLWWEELGLKDRDQGREIRQSVTRRIKEGPFARHKARVLGIKDD